MQAVAHIGFCSESGAWIPSKGSVCYVMNHTDVCTSMEKETTYKLVCVRCTNTDCSFQYSWVIDACISVCETGCVLINTELMGYPSQHIILHPS